MARNPALWIRVPNGGTPDNPAVYTAIRDSLREISEAVRLLQGGPTATAAGQKTTAGGTSLPYTNSGPNIYLPLAGGTLTGLLVTDAPDTASSGFRLPHGTAPSSPVNGDMWTTTSGLYAQINGITVGPFSAASGVYLPLAGGTMTGLLTTAASATGSAGFNLPHGAAPTTPVNGDLWTTTTGIYARINGTTVGPLAATPTGQALTRVNDTNVTVTLGGSPSTALLAATSLTLGWSGQLSIARGGTGQSTAVAAFDALSPLTTLGDIIYHNGTDNVRLAGNTTTTRQFLRQVGTGAASAAPVWDTLQASDIPSLSSLYLPLTGGTMSGDINMGSNDISSALTVGIGGAATYPLHVMNTITGTGTSFSAYIDTSIAPSSASVSTYAGVGVDIDSTGANLTGEVRGGYFNVTNAGSSTLSATIGVFGKTSISSTGGITAGYSVYAAGPSNTSTGVMTSAYGVFIGTQSGTNVTTGYGLYQNGASDINYFNGSVGVGVLPSTYKFAVSGGVYLNGTTTLNNNLLTGVGNIQIADPGAREGIEWLTGNGWAIYESPNTLTNAAGNLQFTRYVAAVDTRLMTLDTSGNLDITGSATVATSLTVDTNTLYVDPTNNRVGVGTTTPTHRVQILQTQNADTQVRITNADVGASASATYLLNLAGANAGFELLGSGASESNQAKVYNSGAGGLVLQADNASGFIAFRAGGSTAASERVRITAAGEVGIGTSPSYPLHIVRTFTGTGDTFAQYNNITVTPSAPSTASYAGMSVALSDTGGNLTGNLRGGYFQVTHAGTATLAAAVGVYGQSNISGTGGVTNAFAFYAAGPSNTSTGVMASAYGIYIPVQKGTNVTTGYGVYQDSTADINYFNGSTGVGTLPGSYKFAVSGTSYFDGDVGIGAAPSYRLDVYEADTATTSGTAYLARLDFRATPSAPSTATYVGLQSSALVSGANAVGDLYGAFIYATHNSSSTATGLFGVVARYLSANTGNTTNGVAFFASTPSRTSTGTITNGYGLYVNTQTVTGVTNGYGIYQAGAADENIFAGNTRIGSTTVPTNALDVTGAATVSGNFTVDTTTLHVDSTNNRVGVGTAAPATVLDILQTTAGSAAVNMSNSSTDPAANARYILNNSATSGGLIIRSTGNVTEPSDMVLYSSANNIRFYTGGNSRASITSTGNFFVDTNVLFVDAASNEVGINTSTPTVALDVVGSAAVSGALTLTTVNLGYTTSGLQLRSSIVGASASTDYFFHRGADSTVMDRIVVHTPNTSGAAFAHMTSGGVTRFLSDGNTGNFVIGTGDAGTAPSGNTLRAPAGAGTNITGGTLTITAGNGTGTGGSGSIVLRTAAVGTTGTTANTMVDRLTLDRAGNVAVGNAALATTATDGFLYIPTCAGVPTGVPTTFTGRVAMVFDTTNNRIYIYDAGWIAFT